MALEDPLETDLGTALQQLGRVFTTFVVCPRCGARTLLGRMDRTRDRVVCLDCSKSLGPLIGGKKNG